MQAGDVKAVFWQLYQPAEQYLEGGHKAEAINVVCRALRVHLTVVEAVLLAQ